MISRDLKLSFTYKLLSILLCSLFLCGAVFAQQQESEHKPIEKLEEQKKALIDVVATLQKIKISGYIQSQYQWGEKDAKLGVGTSNEDPKESFDRFGIRRGRIKFLFEDGIVLGVFQLDMTERGVGVKDTYLNIKDPWFGTSAFKAGIFDRPFGYEISHSSSRRESPERSTVFRALFPEERDVGAQLTLQSTKIPFCNFLKLEVGLFSGNGIKQETDGHKDVIGHLSVNHTASSDVKFGLGLSYYNGGVYQGSESVYTMKDKGFELSKDVSNKGKFAKREYVGFDGQFNIISGAGMTQLRGEYLFGTQPGAKSSSSSPNQSELPTTDVYIRNFSGGYLILVQDFGKLPLSAVLKYDWYDPNTKVSKNEIGLNGTSRGDLAHNTRGFGLLWRTSTNIRLQVYYELKENETTDNLPAYVDDIKDDIFTLRLQYKF